MLKGSGKVLLTPRIGRSKFEAETTADHPLFIGPAAVFP